MKLLTIAVPCYNSENYMKKAVESCLVAGEMAEVLIVDDGSTDATRKIADRYVEMYPNLIRVIHKLNGGHGDAVITGLQNARGKYFKVLDSDDWLDEGSLMVVMNRLKKCCEEKEAVDMFLANYVYEKVAEGKSRSINYRNAFPVDRIFGWEDIHHLHYSQNILMHSVIYRTDMLRECGLKLPKHTFYVDNLYVYIPLPYVNNICYLDTDLYHYFIGREGQSVNEQIMIGRIDQQLLVTRMIIDSCTFDSKSNIHLCKYMLQYLAMMMTVSTVFLIKSGTEENDSKRAELWEYLKETNLAAYKKVNRGILGFCMQFSSKIGKKIILFGYAISKKIYGFN